VRPDKAWLVRTPLGLNAPGESGHNPANNGVRPHSVRLN
jgi:hypothetical protein